MAPTGGVLFCCVHLALPNIISQGIKEKALKLTKDVATNCFHLLIKFKMFLVAPYQAVCFGFCSYSEHLQFLI